MKRIDFNKNWTVRCLTREEGVREVTLPHDAMISEPRNAESKGEGNIGYYVGGDYEYTKTFNVPADAEGKTLVLEFEAIMREAEVYLNDELLVENLYGYLPVTLDVSDKLHYGADNVLRVIAKNQDEPNSRWYTGTGLYRPVWLYEAKDEFIPLYGLRVKTLNYQTREVEVRVRTNKPGTVALAIERDGEVLREAEAEAVSVAAPAYEEGEALWLTRGGDEASRCEAVFNLKLEDAMLWQLGSPVLYTAHARFGEDEASEEFGIRSLTWDAQNGICLNGERVILKGACIHHDNGLLGAVALPEADERRIRILQKVGYNSIRSAHNPASRSLLSVCDRLGMLVMDEYADSWYIHKTKYDYAAPNGLMKHWPEDFRKWISFDYNHPSVIMYSTGNEVAETSEAKGIKLMGDFREYLHKLDNTRMVSCGVNIFFNFLYSAGFGVYSDEKAEKESESNKKKKASVGSEFYNKLSLVVGNDFMKWGASTPPSDWKTREGFANMDVAGYNYGMRRYESDLKKYPERLILGSETFMEDAYEFMRVAKDNPRLVGDFVWSGIDYIGETGLVAQEYPLYDYATADDDDGRRMTCGNGRIDLTGKIRDDGYWTKVIYTSDPGPYILVSPVDLGAPLRLNTWQGQKYLHSWSFRGSEGKPAYVKVYARGASVELLVNNVSVGRKKLHRGKAAFECTYASGEIRAIVYRKDGSVLAEKSLKTAGEKTYLTLMKEKAEVKAGQVAYIHVRYTDENGTLKPTEVHDLKVSVEGGEMVAFGSGNPYVRGNYTDPEKPTYFGEAMVIVRSYEPGDIKVTVTDEAGNKIETVQKVR